jgi:hypothetical protein
MFGTGLDLSSSPLPYTSTAQLLQLLAVSFSRHTNHQRLKYSHAMSATEKRPRLETIAKALLKRNL